jgi:hypothetical protein
MNRDGLLARFGRNAPAVESSIEGLQAKLGFRLPPDYVEFLRGTNGGEGFVGNSYLVLWRAEELLEKNSAYHVAEFAPGLFLIGSDGADEAFGFDTRSEVTPIVRVPFIGMDARECRLLASDFGAFLRRLSES